MPPDPVFKSMGQQMAGTDTAWIQGSGVRVPSGRDIFGIKTFDTFTSTSVRVSKMNAVFRAELAFQMVALL